MVTTPVVSAEARRRHNAVPAFICEGCGCEISSDEAVYDSSLGEVVCQSCHEEAVSNATAASQLSPEDIIDSLDAAQEQLQDGATISEICAKIGINETTYFEWRAEYGYLSGHTEEEARRKFRDAQDARQAGAPLVEVCNGAGISEQTYFRWRRRFDKTKSPSRTDVEHENELLRSLVVELMTDGSDPRHELVVRMRKRIASGEYNLDQDALVDALLGTVAR
jgi:putative transposase